MISDLKNIEHTALPQLLRSPEKWNSVDVKYHPPRVRRVWTQIGQARLFLHIIDPCETSDALYHPHPWPSAMHIIPISGKYEMGLGYYDFHQTKIIEIAKVILSGNNYYEMLDKNGFHYVRPVDKQVYSVMLIGKPWDNNLMHLVENPKEKQEPLLEEEKIKVLETFKILYP